VEVGAAVVKHLHLVVGDGAKGVLEHKVGEVVLSVGNDLDVLGGDGGEEGEVLVRVQGGDLLGVLGLEGVVPRLEVVASNLLHVGRGRSDGRVVVGDLPVAVVRTPHVGEARRHGRAGAGVAQLESVHARVEVSIAAVEHLHRVVGDGAKGVLEHKVLEVVLGAGDAFDVLGGDGGEEGELARGIHVGDGQGVLGLEGVVPSLEVGTRSGEHVRRRRRRGSRGRGA